MHTHYDESQASHDPKFRNVTWFGEEFSFSPQQAKCVEVLWRFWMQHTPIIREEMVLEVAGLKARTLKEVFSSGPGKCAWGRMIDAGDHRGTVHLLVPHFATSESGQPAAHATSA